jgi:Topoisomerase DNA binding C4 zinc finger
VNGRGLALLGRMADPLAEFQHKLFVTSLAFVIPAAIVAGLIQVFKRDVERWLVAKLRALFHGKPKPAAARQDEVILDAPPCCPECRLPMVKRKARKGDNRGSQFWGCSTFPRCRGTRATN